MKPCDAEGKKFIEKARCCVRGNRQLAYVYYDSSNIYAPVASHDSTHMLLAIAASEEIYLEVVDVSNAYLYGDLDVPIFMEQPTDSSQKLVLPGYACKLLKSIYGAKQAGEIWRSLLDKSLRDWGFKVSKFDERIYFYHQRKDFIVLAIVIDDHAFASNPTQLMNHLKQNLSANFDVKCFGTLTSFVGWNTAQSKRGIKINQSGYIKQMLKDPGTETANAVKSPLPKTGNLLPAIENEQLLDH